jgi:GNAT superfamily N-acetyltransferase
MRKMNYNGYMLERYETPLPEDFSRELLAMWQAIFEVDFPGLSEILSGNDIQNHRDIVYLARKEGKIASTCRLTISRSDPRIGGLAEVATHPEHRGKNLGFELCQWAAKEFDESGGQANFLGTVNPIAAKLYAKLGWRYLAGTKVMVRVSSGKAPEEFLVDYFRNDQDLPVKIESGSSVFRVTMIPLILRPHDWMILDANLNLGSTRFMMQKSCEGLYPRYASLKDTGAWFAAVRADGVVVGLASVKNINDRTTQIEAFTADRYQESWLGPLYQQAAQWTRDHQGLRDIQTSCAKDDPIKPGPLKKLGFTSSSKMISHQIGEASMDLIIYPSC